MAGGLAGAEVVVAQLDDLCFDIWVSVMITCLINQITDRQGTAINKGRGEQQQRK